jgi:hypothetical protein
VLNLARNSLILFFFLNSNAYAYLDPYSGSLILSFIAGIFSFVVIYFRKLKIFFSKFFDSSKKNKDDKNIE